jgi:hypothetical protein
MATWRLQRSRREQEHSVSSELVPTAPAGELTSFEASLAAERDAEQILMRSITKSVIVGVPVGILFFMGLLTIAIGGDTEWYVIVGLGGALGILAAAMFGMLGGVTLVAHALEEVDRGGPVHVADAVPADASAADASAAEAPAPATPPA